MNELAAAAADDKECEVDLEQFMTVDSVGDVDDIHNGDEIILAADDATMADKKDGDDSPPAKAPRAEINVGNEHMRMVSVYYCDLCRFCLPSNEDQEQALKKHCATRSHLRAYLRYKENQHLRLAAERIHRRHQEQREVKKAAAAATTNGLFFFLSSTNRI